MLYVIGCVMGLCVIGYNVDEFLVDSATATYLVPYISLFLSSCVAERRIVIVFKSPLQKVSLQMQFLWAEIVKLSLQNSRIHYRILKVYTHTQTLTQSPLPPLPLSPPCSLALERMDIARIEWSPAVGGLFSGFGISLFLFYSVAPWVIRMSSAVVLNLSLLTADFYSLIFGIFLFDYNVSDILCLVHKVHRRHGSTGIATQLNLT